MRLRRRRHDRGDCSHRCRSRCSGRRRGAASGGGERLLGQPIELALQRGQPLIVLLDFFNDRIGSLDELKRATALPVRSR